MTDNEYYIYNVPDFTKANAYFIKNKYEKYDLSDLINKLNEEKYYNFRISKSNVYHLFGDVDGFNDDINLFSKQIISFLNSNYDIVVGEHDVKLTMNEDNKNSYHYSIPMIHGSIAEQKIFHENFKKQLRINGEHHMVKSIDTSIYSNHWFRCPNQKKGKTSSSNVSNKIHRITNGNIEDFIIAHIPKKSQPLISQKNENQPPSVCSQRLTDVSLPQKEIMKHNNECVDLALIDDKCDVSNNNNVLSSILARTHLYKKMFDECYEQKRFEEYVYWLSVGMAIKNTFVNTYEAIELFDYFSSKGSNYEGFDITKQKFDSFTIKKNMANKYTLATIHYYALQDNKSKFIEIINKNTFDLEQTDMCKYFNLLSNNRFIYQCDEHDSFTLYCFNGKFWETNSIIMRRALSTELHDFLKTILVEVYWNHRDFNIMKNRIEKLKTISFKKDVIETYKEYALNNDVKFDDKSYLFGFKDKVYDLQKGKFRDYEYDDYLTVNCGYNWKEPTNDEINTINELLCKIMPVKDERDTLLQIMCTGLDGKCLERFTLFNAGGGNGKGVINDLFMCALGDYGFVGNNAILFESSRTGSSPEKANLHKKRYVVFREPPANKKFSNSVIKELTGGGTFDARTHHEKKTKKNLNLTMVVECNQKPLFSEEPKDAEARRIIDIYFRATFTNNKELLDDSKYVYEANQYYKTKIFQEKYRYALLKILFSVYDNHINKNNEKIKVAKEIESRTNAYLERSCLILTWFKENYKLTDDKNELLTIGKIFDFFKEDEIYSNMSKYEKKTYNKKYFINYFENNIFTRKYFCGKYQGILYVMKRWIKIDNIDNK